MKFTKSLSIATAAVVFLGSTAFAQTTSGKLGLTKGQKLQVDNNIKSVISQEMAGQAIEITVDANMVHQLEVKDKKDKSYIVSSTLTKLSTNGNAMGNSLSFDSDKKEDLETEAGKAMKDRLNVSQEVEFNENAVVINGVKATDKVSSGGQLLDMINNVTGGGNDNSNGANAAFEVMPQGKKVGDSWSDSTITEEIKTYRNYTLKEIKGNVATLTLTGKQVTNKKVEQQGMQITVNMQGKLSGEEFVDMKTGILQEKTVTLDGTGNIEVMEQSMPMSTKVTTRTVVKAI